MRVEFFNAYKIDWSKNDPIKPMENIDGYYSKSKEKPFVFTFAAFHEKFQINPTFQYDVNNHGTNHQNGDLYLNDADHINDNFVDFDFDSLLSFDVNQTDIVNNTNVTPEQHVPLDYKGVLKFLSECDSKFEETCVKIYEYLLNVETDHGINIRNICTEFYHKTKDIKDKGKPFTIQSDEHQFTLMFEDTSIYIPYVYTEVFKYFMVCCATKMYYNTFDDLNVTSLESIEKFYDEFINEGTKSNFF